MAPAACARVSWLPLAGTGRTPLTVKLGIRSGHAVAVLGGPDGFAEQWRTVLRACGADESFLRITADLAREWRITTESSLDRWLPIEVTLTTGAAGSDSNGEGAVQIKFVTRSGSNTTVGSGYEYLRDSSLNTKTGQRLSVDRASDCGTLRRRQSSATWDCPAAFKPFTWTRSMTVCTRECGCTKRSGWISLLEPVARRREGRGVCRPG